MDIEAVIFDCDGVLVDTEYLKFLAWQKALNEFQIDLVKEEYKAVAGHTSKRILELLQEMKKTSIPEEAIFLRRSEYQKLQFQGVKPIQENIDFARRLRENKDQLDIKIGLASSASKNEIMINLKQIGMENFFDLIISGKDDLANYSDEEGTNKPKPYIYQEAAKRLAVRPEKCLVFEDTEAGIEAAAAAGMIAIAIPNWMTKEQDFTKANKVLQSISEIFFNTDEDLESDPQTKAEKCLQEFFHKGGNLHCIANLTTVTQPFQIREEDAIYPICAGGFCRSQTLWAILQPFSEQIVLFPPHAARCGWDPYNGQINRYKNYAREEWPDEFSLYFGIQKAVRFGFENIPSWKWIEQSPSDEGLKTITEFYNSNYFGPQSAWQGKTGKRRIYVTFSKNTHVVLLRLIQANESLKNVTVVAIDAEDIVTFPPEFLNTTSRSVKAYEHFAQSLKNCFIFPRL
jgi:HAD superfamily hydrolase (TIGR01509 family)